jgi:hypothetical protein
MAIVERAFAPKDGLDSSPLPWIIRLLMPLIPLLTKNWVRFFRRFHLHRIFHQSCYALTTVVLVQVKTDSMHQRH